MANDESRDLDGIDSVDMGIIHLLQQNARTSTTSSISEKVGVSSSTVGNRINNLEEVGIITGYRPTLDYEKAGFDHYLLVTGTVPLEELESKAGEALDVNGVVNVRELLTNEQNISIEIVGANRQRIREILHELNDAGVHVERMQMVNRERNCPLYDFGRQHTDEADDES